MVKRLYLSIGLFVALAGCGSESPIVVKSAPIPPLDNEIVATVRGYTITLKDMQPILIQGYGLDVLLKMAELDLARDEALRARVEVTPNDFDQERIQTLTDLKKSLREVTGGSATQPADTELTQVEMDQLLSQLLEREHMSRSEFDIVMQINAYLRKMAEPTVRSQMTEDAVRERFNILYGEKAVVRYIVCGTMTDAQQVRRDLGSGKSFEDVARTRSLDRASAANGGEFPPFTLHDNRFPPEFEELAFLLKKGEVSDPLQIGNFIYIVKMIDRIPPEHAKFEDYRDAVRVDLYNEAIRTAIKAMQQRLGAMALESMHIQNAVLKQQWDDRLAKKDQQLHDMEEIRKRMDEEHLKNPTTGPDLPGAIDDSTTQPSPEPAPLPPQVPATAP